MNYIGLILKGFQGQTIEIVSFFEKFNMYQAKETKNNTVTTPLYTEADLNKLIESQGKINQSEEIEKNYQLQKESELKEIEQEESIFNFKSSDPKQHAKAKAHLNRTIKYNGQWLTRKEYVLSILNQNYEVFQCSRGKYHFRNIDEDRLTEATKTEADFFNYLKQNKQLLQSA